MKSDNIECDMTDSAAVNPNTRSYRVTTSFLFSLSFATAYATILATLPIDVFKDRANYLVYAKDSADVVASFYSINALVLLANEPIWLFVNSGLSKFFGPEATLRIVIFFPSFVVSFLLVKENPKNVLWMIFFLVMPLVVKNHVVHLRQGLGIAFFLFGYYSRHTFFRVLWVATASFIHSSFLVIGAIGLSVWLYRQLKLPPRLRLLLLAISFSGMGFLLIEIASALGARQGQRYADTSVDISGVGFIFWFLILLVFLSRGAAFARRNMFPLGVLLFYLASYFQIAVGARILESAVISILIAGVSLTGWPRQAFLFLIVIYSVAMYVFRIGEPWLGWGVV